MASIISVNTSLQKGTVKTPVQKIYLSDLGVEGDAHSGRWHRQVSLLAEESMIRFRHTSGREVKFGEFAENITTRGIQLHTMHPLDRLRAGEVILEVTQIGKECHGSNCAIYNEVGNCVMPKEGIFARVIQPGILKAGDTLMHSPKIFKAAIITLSDRAALGEYADKSGPAIHKLLTDFFLALNVPSVIETSLIPDDAKLLQNLITGHTENAVDIIITTGGTGIGPRDITPDVVAPMLEKQIPGIMEMIRFKYGSQKPNALLSRAIAGVIGKTLIYTLPGSVKAVNEYMNEILPTLKHSIFMLHQIDSH